MRVPGSPALVVVVAAAAVLVATTPAAAFYLPGVAPREYETGVDVQVKVDKISSVRKPLPFSYYDLPFCTPADAGIVNSEGKLVGVENQAENLGEVLAGDRMESTGFQLKMRYNLGCRILCRKKYTAHDVERLQEFIRDQYRVNLWMDNLPGAQKLFDSLVDLEQDMARQDARLRGAATGVAPRGRSDDSGDDDDEPSFLYKRGYLIGVTYEEDEDGNPLNNLDRDTYVINNHLQFIIRYHEAPVLADGTKAYEGSRIVGFELVPYSINHEYDSWTGSDTYLHTCNDNHQPSSEDMSQMLSGPDTEVVFTYQALWVPDPDTPWAQRWDIYFRDADPDKPIHWFAILNSLLIVLSLSAMVAMIVLRTVYRDIATYNDDEADDLGEETGWKLVHGDVFRPNVMLPSVFSVLVGCGNQILVMTFVMIIFACFGFLSPANRGGLMTALVLLYVFAGVVAGFKSARLYKFFKGKDWRMNAIMSALLIPGGVFAVFFILNLFVWGTGSVSAIPFTTLIAILLLWFGVSVPLCFVGSYFGFSKPSIEVPCTANQIPRHIPPQPWYLHPLITISIGGLLPFGAIFIEIFFIMSALWMQTMYYVFGFLLVVLAILVITCAEICIVLCYFQLCTEDYDWWWRSFFTGASTGAYLLLYSFLYFFTKLEITDFTSAVLYFGYMGIISGGFSLLTGSIGFEACFWFNKKIFAAIKID